MRNKADDESENVNAVADVYSGSSLIPMLVSGLVLIVLGMITVALFS